MSTIVVTCTVPEVVKVTYLFHYEGQSKKEKSRLESTEMTLS